MKKIILPALAGIAALSLGACSASDDTPEAATTDAAVAAEADTSAAATTATTTDAAAGTTATVDTTTPDSVTISEDGVNANINDGGTSVNANVDGDPSVTVTDR